MQDIKSKPWEEMIEKICWHISAGGATAPSFVLVLGERIARSKPLRNLSQPKEFRENRGSIELLVWSSWRLQTTVSVLASSDQGNTGITELRKLVGEKVVDVFCKQPAWDLEIGFTGGYTLLVFCDHVAPCASIDQNWELWVPGSYISAGPGVEFDIRRDDV